METIKTKTPTVAHDCRLHGTDSLGFQIITARHSGSVMQERETMEYQSASGSTFDRSIEAEPGRRTTRFAQGYGATTLE
jgi:hypothetical protein